MGAVRILLPLPRTLARAGVGVGGPLLGAALLRCLTPGLFLLWQRPPARRLAWSAEAVAVYRALLSRGGPRRRNCDGLARALVHYADALYLTDQYDDALAAADESLAVPGARMSQTQTAYALRVRTLVLAEMGRLDEALETARQCVAAYRDAVPRGRDKSLGSLAGALRIQAWVLGTMGRVEESVALYMECAALLRAMPLLKVLLRTLKVQVRVLIELTGGLRTLGRYEEAIAAGTDAQWWAADVTPWFYPDILQLRAQLLTDLAWCHWRTGDPSRARESAERAVTVCRELVERTPDIGEPRLALALQSRAYLGGGRAVSPAAEQSDPQKLADLQELSDLCARLTVTDPGAFEPMLACALDDMAYCHGQSGAHRQAVEATERSVAVYRRAARRDPQEYEPELARTLANLVIRKRQVDVLDDTVAHAREALAITRRLAETDQDPYQSLTAQRLGILARSLRRTGDDEQALACYDEAETILRDLMETDPGFDMGSLTAVLTDLADTLRSTAESHLTTGHFDDAVSALRRLLALTRRTDQTAVHAACLTAFAHARGSAPDEIKRAWQAGTTDPFPSFVYRAPSS
ncbi:tetratricopeptide repeat protein [Streptomyces sp. NBC_00481]|uniref:tetratricopeptide repeat protein n=1 Tax=unclassified Streptomyces TaxID=2593676 RepID=UPI002DD87BE0|nr:MULTISPECIES: tetratricopeptide repeat protein [unclassified Streptomyces]WRY97574.1 tetratricopeptide repeat protein [Streptomyces sp. NBC_00481]